MAHCVGDRLKETTAKHEITTAELVGVTQGHPWRDRENGCLITPQDCQGALGTVPATTWTVSVSTLNLMIHWPVPLFDNSIMKQCLDRCQDLTVSLLAV